MELAAFVAQRAALRIFDLSRAELQEILCRLGSNIRKQFHLDPTKRLA